MGYFDALCSGDFKTTEDGQKIFYPWGIIGPGYIIPSELNFNRLRLGIKIYWALALPFAVTAYAWRNFPLYPITILLILFITYHLWAWIHCRGTRKSEVKYTLKEARDNQTRSLSVRYLWFVLALMLPFAAICIIMLIVDPGQWLIAVPGIVFFGGLITITVKMLIAKRNLSLS